MYNFDEDMVANIEKLAPFRWKVFQYLLVARAKMMRRLG
jgi:radical S-adenosyl methionine domain-containing protein 2